MGIREVPYNVSSTISALGGVFECSVHGAVECSAATYRIMN